MSKRPTEHEHVESKTSKYSKIKEKKSVGHVTSIVSVDPAKPPFPTLLLSA